MASEYKFSLILYLHKNKLVTEIFEYLKKHSTIFLYQDMKIHSNKIV